ncbi:MAG: cytidine deaminase [Saprospiraceae bacterium]
MKKKTIKATISIYKDETELDVADHKLIKRAKKALKDSYSPYSNFKVGAAVLLMNGKTVVGSNQENAAYPVCICAERTALANASSKYPKIKVAAIAITAESQHQVTNRPVSPCGTCRQYLLEVENRYQHPIRIIMQGVQGPVYTVPSAKSLLPLSFDGSQL